MTGKQTNIIATCFGGPHDHERSAYDAHLIGANELCCSLPYHFHGRIPRVRVYHGDKNVTVTVQDVGPWNVNDPYWLAGRRPQAESGRDRFNRKTNKAGIDLSPAVISALTNLSRDQAANWTGKVDWEFVE